MIKTAIILALFITGFAGAKPNKGLSADGIMKKFQSRWDLVIRYKANFSQKTRTEGALSEGSSTGKVTIHKPSKFRWESTTDDSTQIINGTTFYNIQENKRRGNRTIDVYDNFKDESLAKPIGLLSGKIKFLAAYKANDLKNTGSVWVVRLVPKSQKTETLIAEIDKKSYLLGALVLEDPASTVRVEFTDSVINPELDDKVFTYEGRKKDIVNKMQ